MLDYLDYKGLEKIIYLGTCGYPEIAADINHLAEKFWDEFECLLLINIEESLVHFYADNGLPEIKEDHQRAFISGYLSRVVSAKGC